jgi:HNH endonuclease
MAESKESRNKEIYRRREAGERITKLAREFGISHQRVNQICFGLGMAPREKLTRDLVIKDFWDEVEIGGPDACWPWKGPCDRAGYGFIFYDDRSHKAHRLAWEIDRKRKAGRWFIRHRCDNPPCCNPRHLFRGTTGQNMSEASKRGRVASKLTKEAVRLIRSSPKNLSTHTRLAKRFGVTPMCIYLAATGHTWKHV